MSSSTVHQGTAPFGDPWIFKTTNFKLFSPEADTREEFQCKWFVNEVFPGETGQEMGKQAGKGVMGFRTRYLKIWPLGLLSILSWRGLRNGQKEGGSDRTLLPWRQEINLPRERCPPCTRRKGDILTTRDSEFKAMVVSPQAFGVTEHSTPWGVQPPWVEPPDRSPAKPEECVRCLPLVQSVTVIRLQTLLATAGSEDLRKLPRWPYF